MLENYPFIFFSFSKNVVEMICFCEVLNFFKNQMLIQLKMKCTYGKSKNV